MQTYMLFLLGLSAKLMLPQLDSLSTNKTAARRRLGRGRYHNVLPAERSAAAAMRPTCELESARAVLLPETRMRSRIRDLGRVGGWDGQMGRWAADGETESGRALTGSPTSKRRPTTIRDRATRHPSQTPRTGEAARGQRQGTREGIRRAGQNPGCDTCRASLGRHDTAERRPQSRQHAKVLCVVARRRPGARTRLARESF